jgi:hypothetical protein
MGKLAPGYRTQSADTSPEAEALLIDEYRRMPSWVKVDRLSEIIRAAQELAIAGIRRRHPTATDDEIRLRLAALRLDRDTMKALFNWDPEIKGY